MRALLTSFLLVIVALVRGATVTDLVQNAVLKIPTNAALVFTPISAPLWVDGVLTTGDPQGTRVDRNGRISIDLAGGYYSLQIGTNSRRFTVGVPPGTGTYQLAQLVSNTIAFLTNVPPALYEVNTNKGRANGYASLGADGLVPAEQLPAGNGGGGGGVGSFYTNNVLATSSATQLGATNGSNTVVSAVVAGSRVTFSFNAIPPRVSAGSGIFVTNQGGSNFIVAGSITAAEFTALTNAVAGLTNLVAAKEGTNNSTHFGYLRLPRTNDYLDFNQTWNIRRYPDDTLHFDYPDVAATPLLIRPNGITVSNIYIPSTNVFIQWNGVWSLVAWADGSFRLLNDDTGTTPFSVGSDGTVTAPAFVGDGSGLTGLPGLSGLAELHFENESGTPTPGDAIVFRSGGRIWIQNIGGSQTDLEGIATTATSASTAAAAASVTNAAQQIALAGLTNLNNGKQTGSANLTNWSALDTNVINNAASNRVVVLAGANVTVTKTSTNGTNFYAVASTGGGGGSANVIADSSGRGTNLAVIDGLSSTNSALGSDPLTEVLGFHAGLGATSSVMSAWFGRGAGDGASNAPESTLFGYGAGSGIHDGQAVTAIGWTAAQNMTRSSSAIAIGYQAMEGADLMPSAIAIGVHNSQGAADSGGMVNIGYYNNGNNSSYSVVLGMKGGWGSPYRWWMDGYRGAIGEEYKPMFDAYFLDRWFRLRGRQIIENTNEAATDISFEIRSTGTASLFSASSGSMATQVEKFAIGTNGNVTAAGTFYGNGAGLTNVAVSVAMSNIVIRDTNAIILNFGAASEFALTILTNFNLVYSNVSSLKGLGFVHFLMGTNGGCQLQSALVTGGLLRTNANQQPTTNANAYDILEVKRDMNLTNLATWWPQNFLPRIATDKHLGTSEFVQSATGGSQDLKNNSGFKFTVGGSDISVTDIGMFADAADFNSAVTVAIKSADCGTTIASASIDTSAHDGAYHYTGITPTTLTAGTTYNIIWTGGATIFQYGISAFTTTAAGTIISDNYDGCNNPLYGAGAMCRGPNFKYQ